MHLGVGMHRALALDLLPGRFATHAPRARGGRRVAEAAALVAGLQVEIVRGAMLEVFDVLDIEIVEPQVHAHVVAVDGCHLTSPNLSKQPGTGLASLRPSRVPSVAPQDEDRSRMPFANPPHPEVPRAARPRRT